MVLKGLPKPLAIAVVLHPSFTRMYSKVSRRLSFNWPFNMPLLSIGCPLSILSKRKTTKTLSVGPVVKIFGVSPSDLPCQGRHGEGHLVLGVSWYFYGCCVCQFQWHRPYHELLFGDSLRLVPEFSVAFSVAFLLRLLGMLFVDCPGCFSGRWRGLLHRPSMAGIGSPAALKPSKIFS